MTDREKLLAVFCALALVAQAVREATRAFWERRRDSAREKREQRHWGGLRQIGKALGITLKDEDDPKHAQSVFDEPSLTDSDKRRIAAAFKESSPDLDPTRTRAGEPDAETLRRAAPTPRGTLPPEGEK